MARTFLQLMQQACNEISIPEPSAIIGAQDDQSKQLLALAIREGREFSASANEKGGWQNLHKEYTFLTEALPATTGDTVDGSFVITNIPSTAGVIAGDWAVLGDGLPAVGIIASVDSATQITLTQPCTATATGVTLNFGKIAYDLPSDFGYFVQRTFWDGAYRWELLGPITAQEKQILRYGIIASGPRRKFYVRSNKLWLDPVPPVNGEVIAYDYYSTAWCASALGVSQNYWLADTDVYLLDEDAFISGIKWRFLRAKGLDYAQEKIDYETDCQRIAGRDGGSRDLPIAGGTYGARFLDYDNIPETNLGH